MILISPNESTGHAEAEFGMSWCANFGPAFWKAYHEILPRVRRRHALCVSQQCQHPGTPALAAVPWDRGRAALVFAPKASGPNCGALWWVRLKACAAWLG